MFHNWCLITNASSSFSKGIYLLPIWQCPRTSKFRKAKKSTRVSADRQYIMRIACNTSYKSTPLSLHTHTHLKAIFLSLAYKGSFETLCGRDKGSTVCSLEKVKQESLRTHQSTSLVKRYINDSFFGNTKWQVLTFFKNYIRVNIPSPTYAKTVWTVKPWFFWQSIIVSQISFTKDWEIVSPFNLTWVTRCCENKLNFLNIIF